ncbi:Fc.00g034350.m01.CDS01 [Cosmosporella sp. VM-42]
MPLPGRGFLRLLTHLYKDEEGIVHGKLIMAPLNSAPPYVALSYTWGCPYPVSPEEAPEMRIQAVQRNKEILIEGKRLAITQNLLDYLQLHAETGMEESETPDFWIDAICINQEDNAEKAEQVSQMHTIYKASSAVLVWLGPEDKFTADAVEFITKIATVETGDNLRPTLLKVPPQKVSDALGDIAHSDGHWSAVTAFFLRQWFRRIWIIQEIVLAREIFVLIGTTEVGWSQIRRTAAFIPKYAINARHPRNSMFISFMSILDVISSLYDEMEGRLYLGYMLPQCRMFECGNLRDKVYGAFGWTVLSKALEDGPGCERETKVTNEVLTVDYNEPTPVTYTRVIKHIYEEDRILDALMCARDPGSTFFSQLPSWVPDLSVGGSKVDVVGIKFGAFSATKSSDAIVFKSAELRLLETMGQEVDSVSMVRVLVSPNVRDSDVNLDRLLQTIEACLEVMAAARKAHLEEAAMGALFDVITGGRAGHPEIERLTPADGGAFLWNAFMYYTNRGSSSKMEAVTSAALRCSALLRELAEELAPTLSEDEAREGTVVGMEEPTAGGLTLMGLQGLYPNQALFLTDKGRIGIGCYDISESDAVWLVPGLRQPVALRRNGNGFYKNLGRCYVSGLMQGDYFSTEALIRVTLD